MKRMVQYRKIKKNKTIFFFNERQKKTVQQTPDAVACWWQFNIIHKNQCLPGGN